MPTGYTSIIDDKPETTFRDFALRCTRAMGVCARMREDSIDIPPPQIVESDPYHETKQHEAEAKLQELEQLTDAEIAIRCDAYNLERSTHNEQYRLKEADVKRRYREMLAQVEAWSPPSPEHVRFKEFMIEQLNTGGMLNCKYEIPEFKPKTARQWFKEGVESAKHDIQYYKEHWEKEQAGAKTATEWLQQMYASLPETL
jgi:hypothetical protein